MLEKLPEERPRKLSLSKETLRLMSLDTEAKTDDDVTDHPQETCEGADDCSCEVPSTVQC